MKGRQRFILEGQDEIYTPGIDYGRPIKILSKTGDRMILQVPGHMVWAGNYQPRRYYGALYMAAVDGGDGFMDVVMEEQPGRKWRPVVDRFSAWAENQSVRGEIGK